MSRNLPLTLGAQRNEDYGLETWRFTDNASGDALDITGWTFEFRVAVAPGATPDLVVTGTANANGSYFAISDAGNGCADFFVAKEDIAALPGRAIDVCNLAYNILVTDALGSVHAYIVGPFIASPGV